MIEWDIYWGLFRPETKLPPQQELADFLGIHVSTVSQAFHLAAQKGLLSDAIEIGTF